MVFSSLPFLCIFLPAVFLLYLVIPSIKARNALLIIASLIFYAYGEPVYVLLMIASTVANYLFARLIQGWSEPATALVGKHSKGGSADGAITRSASDDANGVTDVHGAPRRFWLIVAVIANLGTLAVFKYTGMMVTTFDSLTGLALPIPQIVLPIGISFYTFQALSYVIDVYRGDVEAQRNYFRVLLYISFFPQLIAGPIVKYHDIAKQIADRSIDATRIAQGFRRFLVGLAKKVLIADTAAFAVDALYANGNEFSTLGAWIVALGYLIQIYYDFSGYSDMAIGLGRMFGFDFKENFDHPYRSASIREFWRRWHISLSTWFKEYLYIPLGGNRKGRARACLNKVIVFFLCGLWHGAAWTFVLWGLYHGFFLLLEEFVPLRKLPRPIGIVYALLVVTIGFVLFRADSLPQAIAVVQAMFGAGSTSLIATSSAVVQLTPLFVVTMALAFIGLAPIKEAIVHLTSKAGSSRARIIGSYIASIVLLSACILTLSSGSYDPFIYFRF